MSLRPQPSTVLRQDSAGVFVARTTTGFSGAEWWGGLFLFPFVAGWAASLVPAVAVLANAPGAGVVFMLAFLAIWIPTGALAAFVLIWGIVGGRETVILDSAAVVLRQRLGPFELTRRYKTSAVSDFRVLTGETVFRSGYAVAFTVNGRTIRFGNWPDRNEGEAVAQALSARLADLTARPADAAADVIEFRARPEWPRDCFLLFWLIAWMAGGSGLLVSDNAFQGWQTIVFTVAWFFIAALIATVVIRDLLRRQRVSAGPTGIEIQRSLGPLRWTRNYDHAAIRSLRAVPMVTDDGPEEDRFELGLDAGRSTVRFGIGLTRTEAEAAARELNERLYS